MLNYLLTLLGFRAPSVDVALGALTKAQRKLNKAATAQSERSAKLHTQATELFSQSNLAAREAERANRVARNINELVS